MNASDNPVFHCLPPSYKFFFLKEMSRDACINKDDKTQIYTASDFSSFSSFSLLVTPDIFIYCSCEVFRNLLTVLTSVRHPKRLENKHSRQHLALSCLCLFVFF